MPPPAAMPCQGEDAIQFSSYLKTRHSHSDALFQTIEPILSVITMMTLLPLLGLVHSLKDPNVGYIERRTMIVAFKSYVSKSGIELRVETEGDKLFGTKKPEADGTFKRTVVTTLRSGTSAKDTTILIDKDLRSFRLTSGTIGEDAQVTDWTPLLKGARITATWSSLLMIATEEKIANKFLDSLEKWEDSGTTDPRILYLRAGAFWQYAGILGKDSDGWHLTSQEAKQGLVRLAIGAVKGE